MRISLVISALTCGGAERVLTTMAHHFSEQGHQVQLITLAGEHPPFYPLHPQIRILPLNMLRPSTNLFQTIPNTLRRLLALRQAFKTCRPDVVISFMDMTNVLCLWASCRLGVPVLVTEHIDPALHEIGCLRNLVRRLSYPLAHTVVVLTRNVISYFPKGIREKCLVIPNPITVDPEGTPAISPNRPTIMAMGRLARQKGFDILLKSFALVAPQFPDWSLYIVGEGEMRTELESSCRTLGLEQRIHLIGNLPNPHPVLASGEFFVLPSRYEGFPMALCEALALGLPAVATHYSAGIKDILQDGDGGLLVPVGDVQELAAGMARLMSDADLRTRMAQRAKISMARYGVEQVMRAWDAVLSNATQKDRPKGPRQAADPRAWDSEADMADSSRPGPS